jgi:signal transduction histidine kinase
MAVVPIWPFVLLSAVFGMGVAFLGWLFRDTPGARPLAVFMIAASLWSLAEGISQVAPGTAKVFWTQLAWTFSPIVPVAWLGTVLTFSGRDDWLAPRWIAVVLVEPVVFVALVWTSGNHELIWAGTELQTIGAQVVLVEDFSFGFWGHLAYSYLLITIGAGVLLRLIFRTSREFRNQATALLAAIFFPMVAATLTASNLLPKGVDLIGVGFVISGAIVGGSILYGELLEIAPITRDVGRETAIDRLDDQVIIVDENERVVDVNPAATAFLHAEEREVVGKPLATVAPELAAAIDDNGGDLELQLDRDDGVRYYDVQVSAFDRDYGSVGGRLISLHDVTETRFREEQLDVLNRLVRHNLRNELNVVRGNAELLKETLAGTDGEKRLERIENTIDDIIERSDKVGRVSRSVDSATQSEADLAEQLSEVVGDVRDEYPGAILTLDVSEGMMVQDTRPLAYAFEELLTNAIEHNHHDTPEVSVSATMVDDDHVEVTVSDNGPGIVEQERAAIEQGKETQLSHGSGVGLWLVHWAVRNAGGTLGFEETDDGTTVSARLPASE